MRAIPHHQVEEVKGYLEKVLSLIGEARVGALERQDIDFGDDASVLGYRAYKHLVVRLLELRGSEGWEFLRVYEPKGRLTLQFILRDQAQFVLRVWRADDPDLNAEEKRMMVAAEMAKNLDLFSTNDGTIDRWGLVYQTNSEGLLDTAYFIGYDSACGKAIQAHELVINKTIYTGAVSIEEFPAAVTIPIPVVKLKKLEDKAEGDDNGFEPKDR